MVDQSQILEKFISTIIDDATKESLGILESVKCDKKCAITAAEDGFLKESYKTIKDDISHIRVDTSRQVSKKALECRHALYARREEIAAEVFGELTAKISAFTGTPEYGQRLANAAKKASAALGSGGATVYLRHEDMTLQGTLASCFGQSTVFKEGSFRLGGLIAESSDGRIRIDDTYDTRLTELRGRFAEIVSIGIS